MSFVLKNRPYHFEFFLYSTLLFQQMMNCCLLSIAHKPLAITKTAKRTPMIAMAWSRSPCHARNWLITSVGRQHDRPCTKHDG